MLVVKMLAVKDWDALREIRLTALRESPDMFLHTYEQEAQYDESRWKSEFTRGEWYVGVAVPESPDKPISLLGITRESDTPAHQCFLEYIWVAPEFRRRGFAFTMIRHVLGRLYTVGVRTVFLYVLDGNHQAMRLYKRIGFVGCNYSQPLEARPGRSEELMRISLPRTADPAVTASLVLACTLVSFAL
jgi:ribosomal protein S18 acetylase RimI-like enzyme